MINNEKSDVMVTEYFRLIAEARCIHYFPGFVDRKEI